MTRTHLTTFERDDGTEVTVEYTITPIIPQTYWQPAEGGEVAIVKVTGENNVEIQTTDEEDEKWCLWIFENHEDDRDDYYEDRY